MHIDYELTKAKHAEGTQEVTHLESRTAAGARGADAGVAPRSSQRSSVRRRSR